MIWTKTIEDSDYDEIKFEVAELEYQYVQLGGNGVKIDIGHKHRYWEYGRALKAYYEMDFSKTPNILDVGAGDGLLGPMFSSSEEISITEMEPNLSCATTRMTCNSILEGLNKPKINWLSSWDQLEKEYDVVYSISVIEHVQNDVEFLDKLCSLVAKGGLLFLTTDAMPGPGPHHFDNLRMHNYQMPMIKAMADRIQRKGFSLLGGEADFEYHGNQVFDYSFMSIVVVKQ